MIAASASIAQPGDIVRVHDADGAAASSLAWRRWDPAAWRNFLFSPAAPVSADELWRAMLTLRRYRPGWRMQGITLDEVLGTGLAA